MIVGVMSDSHGDARSIERAVEAMGAVDVWLHAGDYCSDARHLEQCSGVRTIAVAGNCDGLAARSRVDEFIELDGVKLWLTHGHRCSVKSGTQNLMAMARTYGVNAVVYGHTHIAEVTWEHELLILNPGSVARPRFAPPSMIRLSIQDGCIVPELLEIL